MQTKAMTKGLAREFPSAPIRELAETELYFIVGGSSQEQSDQQTQPKNPNYLDEQRQTQIVGLFSFDMDNVKF